MDVIIDRTEDYVLFLSCGHLKCVKADVYDNCNIGYDYTLKDTDKYTLPDEVLMSLLEKYIIEANYTLIYRDAEKEELKQKLAEKEAATEARLYIRLVEEFNGYKEIYSNCNIDGNLHLHKDNAFVHNNHFKMHARSDENMSAINVSVGVKNVKVNNSAVDFEEIIDG